MGRVSDSAHWIEVRRLQLYGPLTSGLEGRAVYFAWRAVSMTIIGELARSLVGGRPANS